VAWRGVRCGAVCIRHGCEVRLGRCLPTTTHIPATRDLPAQRLSAPQQLATTLLRSTCRAPSLMLQLRNNNSPRPTYDDFRGGQHQAMRYNSTACRSCGPCRMGHCLQSLLGVLALLATTRSFTCTHAVDTPSTCLCWAWACHAVGCVQCS